MAACSASVAARSLSPAPSARLIAEETPPPIAPADIICVSMASGNTSAIAASGTVPSRPIYEVSATATNVLPTMATAFGRASVNSVGRIGAVRRPLTMGLAGAGFSGAASSGLSMVMRVSSRL
jgi:hypothetical protein